MAGCRDGAVTRDLVLVRNIIVHSGGWPDNDHPKTIETPDVIVRVNNFFWKLDINDRFFGEVLAAAGRVGVHLNTLFANHPHFRLAYNRSAWCVVTKPSEERWLASRCPSPAGASGNLITAYIGALTPEGLSLSVKAVVAFLRAGSKARLNRHLLAF